MACGRYYWTNLHKIMTNKLTKEKYPSPYNYEPQEYIKQLVQKDEMFVETVVGLQGQAGKPIYQPCEVEF